MGIPSRLTPLLCGYALVPRLSSSSGTVVSVNTSSYLMKWGIKPPFSWQQGSLFDWVGVLCIRVKDASSLVNLTQRGYLPITPPFGLANHDSVPWAVVSVIRSTIWWHLQAVMSFPQPNICDPADVHAYYTLPEVFTYYTLPEVFTCHQWMLQWTSTVEVITTHWSTPGKSCWLGIGWLPNHYSLVASSYFHFPWKLACMGWGWYICPVYDRHLYTRQCQPLMWWEEASFSGGYMTVLIGPSLHRRGCLLQSDTPPHMPHLPTYP